MFIRYFEIWLVRLKQRRQQMGSITRDQSHQVLATLIQNTDWDSVDFQGSKLQDLVIRNPKEAGRQFTFFLQNGARVVVGEVTKIPTTERQFDPRRLFKKRYRIVREKTDVRSAHLREIDLAKVELVPAVAEREFLPQGFECLGRLTRNDSIRLDAHIFLTFWKNPHLIPNYWKEKFGNELRYILFPGTVLMDESGEEAIISLVWDGLHNRWDRMALKLSGLFPKNFFFAVYT